MSYNIKLVRKIDCYFSENLKNELIKRNIKFEDIPVDDITKMKYKKGILKTFPQVYLKNNNKELLIGDSETMLKILLFYDELKNNKLHNMKEKNKILLKSFNFSAYPYLDKEGFKYLLCLLGKKDNLELC